MWVLCWKKMGYIARFLDFHTIKLDYFILRENRVIGYTHSPRNKIIINFIHLIHKKLDLSCIKVFT